MTGKRLHLKRTPAEQAAHDLRKAHKAARKAAKRSARYAKDSDDEHSSPSGSSSRKRQRKEESPSAAGWDYVIDSEGEYGPPPPPSSSHHKPDYENIRAQVEEERFRDKMWGALEDDERLDSMEARLNAYAHVPRRWRSGGMDRMEDDQTIDPSMMEEEDYAEWVRAGMWRKKHADEHAEQVRQEAERAARRKREKTIRAETEKMEREAEEARRRRRREVHRKRWAEERERYEISWKALLDTGELSEGPVKELRFEDVPWPVFAAEIGPSVDKKRKRPAVERVVDIEDVTAEAILTFLLPEEHFGQAAVSADLDAVKKARKEKLRETMLRFHPDKFEGRVMRRVGESDKERVGEAVGRVVRAINALMAEK